MRTTWPSPPCWRWRSWSKDLIQTRKRTAVSVILESGEPRDVHQVAALLGYGARAVNPYLAHECIAELIDKGLLDKDFYAAVADYDRTILAGGGLGGGEDGGSPPSSPTRAPSVLRRWAWTGI